MSKYSELDIRKFKELLSKAQCSTSYKNHILRELKSIFKHSKTYFSSHNDPTYVLVPFKKTFDELMFDKNKENNVWNTNEFNEFVSNVESEQYKALFITLYMTGIRLGESLALTWNDFDGECLDINKSMTRKTEHGRYLIKEPKNISSIRKIPLGNLVSAYLTELKNKEMNMYGFNETWFIFGRTKPLPEVTINRIKNDAIKAANLHRIRLHDFRHSHATNLINNGMNIVAVSKRLGHTDINMTLKVYTHLLQKTDEEITTFLEKPCQFLATK
jgi:Site-specific recombinase XerD